jgi:hypothetical protein
LVVSFDAECNAGEMKKLWLAWPAFKCQGIAGEGEKFVGVITEFVAATRAAGPSKFRRPAKGEI